MSDRARRRGIQPSHEPLFAVIRGAAIEASRLLSDGEALKENPYSCPHEGSLINDVLPPSSVSPARHLQAVVVIPAHNKDHPPASLVPKMNPEPFISCDVEQLHPSGLTYTPVPLTHHLGPSSRLASDSTSYRPSSFVYNVHPGPSLTPTTAPRIAPRTFYPPSAPMPNTSSSVGTATLDAENKQLRGMLIRMKADARMTQDTNTHLRHRQAERDTDAAAHAHGLRRQIQDLTKVSLDQGQTIARLQKENKAWGKECRMWEDMKTVAQRNEAVMRGEHAAMGGHVERLKTELAKAEEAAETMRGRSAELERRCEAYANAGLSDPQATIDGLREENRRLTMSLGRPSTLHYGNELRDPQHTAEIDALRDEIQALKDAGTEKDQMIARASAMFIDQAKRIKSFTITAHAREAGLLGVCGSLDAQLAALQNRYVNGANAAKREYEDLHRRFDELADVDSVDETLGAADMMEDEARGGTVPRSYRPKHQDVPQGIVTVNAGLSNSESDTKRLKEELNGAKAELYRARLALLSPQRQPNSAEMRLQQEITARQALEEKANFLTAELAARDRRIAELFAGQMASRVKIEHLKNHLCAATFRADRLGKTSGTADTTGDPRVEAVTGDSGRPTRDLGWYPDWTNHGEGDVVVLSGDQQCESTPIQEDQEDLFVDSRCTAVDERHLHSAALASPISKAAQSHRSLDDPDHTNTTKPLVLGEVTMPSSAETSATASSNGAPASIERSLSPAVVAIIAGFLAGSHAFESLASMNIASRDFHAITHSTLYETVVFEHDAGPDGASWLQKSAFEAGVARWRYTKFLLLRKDHVKRLERIARRLGWTDDDPNVHFLRTMFPNLQLHLEWEIPSGSMPKEVCLLELHGTVQAPILHDLLTTVRVRALHPDRRAIPHSKHRIPDITSVRIRQTGGIAKGPASGRVQRYRIASPSQLSIRIHARDDSPATMGTMEEVVMFLQSPDLRTPSGKGDGPEPVTLCLANVSPEQLSTMLKRVNPNIVIHKPIPRLSIHLDLVSEKEDWSCVAAQKSFTTAAEEMAILWSGVTPAYRKGYIGDRYPTELLRMTTRTRSGIQLVGDVYPRRDGSEIVLDVSQERPLGGKVLYRSKVYPCVKKCK